jgi:NTP pyrophosphatase (non-canonical NTP hydrolase)
MGLAGETGELLTELKKVKREYGRAGLIHKKRIEEELGDILWYAVTIARRAGLDFQRDILFDNLVGVSKNPSLYMPLVDDDKSPGKSLQEAIQQDGVRTADTFKAYQDHAFKSVESKSDREANHLYLSKIWKNVSDLLIKVDAKSANFSAQECGIVSKVVGDVMWYVAGFATLYNISLNTIAARNSKKVMSKFAPEVDRDRTPHRYDYDFPIREQFPKKFDVVFAPAPSDRRQAVMIINGIRVGDPLNDNAYEIDHYRFHDSIHLAFVAMLGWSPVMRSLMKLKRKNVEILMMQKTVLGPASWRR